MTSITKWFTFVVLILTANGAAAADWPQWRGPDRDGLVPEQDGVRLADRWPDGGPKIVWESEPIPGKDNNDGGYGSVVVAEGRVYLYVNWEGPVTLSSRILTRDSLRRLGWSRDTTLPAVLEAKVETARVSPERMSLEQESVGPWIDDWVAEHLTGEEQRAFRAHVRRRLRVADAGIAGARS